MKLSIGMLMVLALTTVSNATAVEIPDMGNCQPGEGMECFKVIKGLGDCSEKGSECDDECKVIRCEKGKLDEWNKKCPKTAECFRGLVRAKLSKLNKEKCSKTPCEVAGLEKRGSTSGGSLQIVSGVAILMLAAAALLP